MPLQSLDPRINRWDLPEKWEEQVSKQELDQFQTWEVFHQKRENTPYTYVGPVHAPDQEIAFLYAKEQYSRRATCTGLWVAKTQDIQVSPYVGDSESVYQLPQLPQLPADSGPVQAFEIFHLRKRGKPHAHAGTVYATSYLQALAQAGKEFGDQFPCVNVWIIPASKIWRSTAAELEWWTTTADKKYREPVAYKVLEKITAFKTRTEPL